MLGRMYGEKALALLESLGLDRSAVLPGAAGAAFLPPRGAEILATCPATEEPLATLRAATDEDYEAVLAEAQARFAVLELADQHPAECLRRLRILPRPGQHLRALEQGLGMPGLRRMTWS